MVLAGVNEVGPVDDLDGVAQVHVLVAAVAAEALPHPEPVSGLQGLELAQGPHGRRLAALPSRLRNGVVHQDGEVSHGSRPGR